ncbi:DUF3408 domain-containing protein [Myroides sp. 1354]|uniref:DUF3408 domain-containing protein n=1 Tax=unclassified Myroides TaxID=2642485 RepID=UPI002575BCA6|nr:MULTISPECIES: DUF3408 domain-containing protein [unclassified Myroides]MDM1046543.1 DUF3408 domain-containing protein [Myroides sp. R163-1]MDM1057456.1 DUF3408 domain-containing protein [Myroides sp. 1354]MDM1070741.1 DUF3408 domain-containing protein [Myroides sp. 1372]
MNEEFKKKPRIDEEAMMALMVDGLRPNGFTEAELNAPGIRDEEEETMDEPKKQRRVKKEQNSIKKYDSTNYEELFFKDVKSTARHGKSVYIDPKHHKILSRIVQVIAEDKLTIYAYLYNLLEHHFNEFEQQITTSFNEKNKPIF